jgi:hypothetical protein
MAVARQQRRALEIFRDAVSWRARHHKMRHCLPKVQRGGAVRIAGGAGGRRGEHEHHDSVDTRPQLLPARNIDAAILSLPKRSDAIRAIEAVRAVQQHREPSPDRGTVPRQDQRAAAPFHTQRAPFHRDEHGYADAAAFGLVKC